MNEWGLLVNGTSYEGWTEVALTRSVEQLAHTFEASYTELWTGQDLAIPIVEGDVCVVQLNGKDVVNGFVDESDIDYNASSHTMRVAGRSITCDLVDCAAIYAEGKGQWLNQKLQQIAADLCQPFGITVSIQTDLGGPLRRFALQDGETVYEALERACRIRGVLMQESSQGELVLTRAGSKTTRTVIEHGVNVVRGGRTGSWKDRYSKYIVKSQVSGDNQFFGGSASQPKRESIDSIVDRYRPTILQSESQEAGRELQKRADWQRNITFGRSQRLRYTMPGWENAEGLWEPNVLTRVVDPVLRVDRELLVMSVKQTKNSSGAFTDLELVDPKAVSVEPITPPKRNSFL